MIIRNEFVDDTNAVLKYVQADFFWQSGVLRGLFKFATQRYLNACRLLGIETDLRARAEIKQHKSFSCYTLQDAYDIIAAHYRYAHDRLRGQMLLFDDEDLSYKDRLLVDWDYFCTNEVQRLIDPDFSWPRSVWPYDLERASHCDEITVAIVATVCHEHTGLGNTAKQELTRVLAKEYDNFGEQAPRFRAESRPRKSLFDMLADEEVRISDERRRMARMKDVEFLNLIEARRRSKRMRDLLLEKKDDRDSRFLPIERSQMSVDHLHVATNQNYSKSAGHMQRSIATGIETLLQSLREQFQRKFEDDLIDCDVVRYETPDSFNQCSELLDTLRRETAEFTDLLYAQENDIEALRNFAETNEMFDNLEEWEHSWRAMILAGENPKALPLDGFIPWDMQFNVIRRLVREIRDQKNGGNTEKTA